VEAAADAAKTQAADDARAEALRMHAKIDDYAQTRRVTCVLVTDKGTIVAGSMKEGLFDARVKAAPPDSTVARNVPWLHAEENALYQAGMMSAKPMALGVAAATICNGDGSATSPVAGDWPGLYFAGGAGGTLDHIVLRYGGKSGYGSSAGINLADNNALSLTNSQVLDNNGYGLTASYPAALTLQNTTIARSGFHGVYIYEPQHPVTVSGNTIRDNYGYGMNLRAVSAPASLSHVSLSDNTFTGNRYNCIVLQGSVRGGWELPAYPEADQACYRTTGTPGRGSGCSLWHP
jgi:hypothetical protein